MAKEDARQLSAQHASQENVFDISGSGHGNRNDKPLAELISGYMS